jgi:hypothetical protein
MFPSKSCRCPLKKRLFKHESLSGYFGEEKFLLCSWESYKSSDGTVTRLRAEKSRYRGSIFDWSKEIFPSLLDLGLTKLPIMGYRMKQTTAV